MNTLSAPLYHASPEAVESPRVSVVLGTYNRLPYLKLTLASLRQELQSVAHELIVVDGGSTDGTLSWLAGQKDVITLLQHNRGDWGGVPLVQRSWGYFMNLGFKCAQGRYLCMISDDTILVPGAILNGCQELDTLRAARKVGALAFWWRNWPKQQEYWVGQTLGNRLFVNHGLYLREALAEINFVDEQSFRFYCADGDLCLRLWEAGYEILPASDSYVEHFSYANTRIRVSNNQTAKRDQEAYQQKWNQYGLADTDWFYRTYQDKTQAGEQYRSFYRKYRLKKALGRYFKWLQ